MAIDAAGNVLVDQTLVCEASRLLASRSGQDRDGAERLIQLSLLLDAVLVYERLYVLASELPADAATLELRTALIDGGVLRVLDTSQYEQSIAAELGTFLHTRSEAAAHGPRVTLSDATCFVRSALDGTQFRATDGPWSRITPLVVDSFQRAAEGRLDRREFERFHGLRSDRDLTPIEALGTDLLARAFSGKSGTNIVDSASRLRTLVYWRFAAHTGLPFYPSCMRLPQYYQLVNHVAESTQDAVYGAIAESFRTTVEEVYADDAAQVLYLPPALALFLDRVRGGESYGDAVAGLRSEYGPLRAALARLQTESSESASLGDRRKAKRRFREVMTQLRAVASDRGAAVDQALDLAPDIGGVLANPLDVTAYTGNLLTTARDSIRNWWLRRPYRLAFQLRRRLLDVRNYDRLLNDVGVTSEQMAAFTVRYTAHLDRYRTYGPARRPGAGH